MNKTKWKSLVGIATVTSLLAAWGCAKKETPANEGMVAAPEEAEVTEVDVVEFSQAVASLEQGPDSVGAGTVTFSKEADGIRVTAHVVGAPPGTHGFHIHEIGDCSSPDYTSAGGHFNPADVSHGGPEDAERHAGDLGNIEIGKDGSGHLELVSTMISLGEGPDSVIGRGVILHEKLDDLVSQPTGAAGARIACGVVVPVDGD